MTPTSIMRRRDFLGASLFALSASALQGCVTPRIATPPAIGAFGFDTNGKDLTVTPGDDFFRFANGGWMKATQIPADRTRWGSFEILAAKAEDDVKAIIEDIAANRIPPTPNSVKIRDAYTSYMDEAAIEAAGIAPIAADLAKIATAQTHVDIARLMFDPALPLPCPISMGVSLDQKNPERYILSIGHSGLTLPEREFYFKTDARSVEIREKLVGHIERTFTLAGIQGGAAKAASQLALETKIADLHWKVADRRDRDRTYNPRTRADLIAQAGDFPWVEALGIYGVPEDFNGYILREADSIPKIASLFKATPVAQWRDYLSYALIANMASILPRAIEDERFDFFGRTLNGQPMQRDRWKRAVDALNGALGEAIGEIYVQRHFPPDASAKMRDLVENVRKAFGERIDGLSWMTPETKVAARRKLATFRPKIGYPSKWRDYGALDVRAGDPHGNAKRLRQFEHADDISRLAKKTDRDEWFMTPQTVNAYYNSVFNEIVFPAAILQPPFFDPNADPAINYGGIGAVIGHEMGHGFDDQGSKSDENGVLRTWWSDADRSAFETRTNKLVEQYNQFEPLPGLKINGRLSLGENIGDLGGMEVAYQAYRASLGGKPAPVIDGMTGDQRFFLGWAQVWRTLFRPERLRNQVLVGPHSPAEFRVNGVVRNIDAWYAAFNVQPGNALFLKPEDRVRIW
jgi:putative endopeptidase